jgi:hypothetical protein
VFPALSDRTDSAASGVFALRETARAAGVDTFLTTTGAFASLDADSLSNADTLLDDKR